MIKIEVKAEIMDEHGNEARIKISNETSGKGAEILHESLAVVRSITSVLRKNDPLMLVMFLDALKNDHSILLGEGEEEREDEHKATEKSANDFLNIYADLMSKNIIGKEMN